MKLFGYTLIRTEYLLDQARANNYASQRIDELKALLRAEEAEHRADITELEEELTRMTEVKDMLLNSNNQLSELLRAHEAEISAQNETIEALRDVNEQLIDSTRNLFERIYGEPWADTDFAEEGAKE